MPTTDQGVTMGAFASGFLNLKDLATNFELE